MDIKKHHVLVFPAGSEIGLEIYNSLKYSHHVEVFGASGKSDHASFVYEADRYIEDALYVDHPILSIVSIVYFVRCKLNLFIRLTTPSLVF